MDNGLKTFAFRATDDENTTRALVPTLGAATRSAGARDLASADPEAVARRYLQNALSNTSLAAFDVGRVSGSVPEFKSLGAESSPLTRTRIVKFRQQYRKIPVYGSLVTVEMDEDNQLVSINSAVGEPANVDAVASLSPKQALGVVKRVAGYGDGYLDAVPRLNYNFDEGAQRWRLVYVIEDVLDRTASDDEDPEAVLPRFYDYIVDAHSGEVVSALSRTQTADLEPVTETAVDTLGEEREITSVREPNGGKRMLDPAGNVHTHNFEFRDVYYQFSSLPGDYERNPPDWEPSGVSAHANSAAVVAFLKDVLLRDGLDGQGGKVVSSVNCVYKNLTGSKIWKNAARIPGQMIYGQREVDGELVSYAAADDVVAHELLHGLTDATARLKYEFESGALNESYSDIFGILVSNFGEPDIGQWDWRMGEELSASGVPIRDLSRPTNHGQPDHYDDFVDLPEDRDHGGVHTNSGIHNKAAHLILTSTLDGEFLFTPRDVAVLFYHTLTQHLSRTSKFSDSRRGVLLAAEALYRDDEQKQERVAAIELAFDAVGIE